MLRNLIGALVGLAFLAMAVPASAVPIFDNAQFNCCGNLVDVELNLQVGDEVYTDRDYTFTSLPSELQGLEWLQTANDAKNAPLDTLSFDVLVDALLYLWIDDRIEDVAGSMAWVASDGWAVTGLTAITTSEGGIERTYDIYSLLVSGGTLGFLTGAQDGASFYGIAGVAVQVPEPTALLLIGGGLIVISFARRRRKTA